MSSKKRMPKIGLLALTLELYESLAPGLRSSREDWLRRHIIPALSRNNEVIFTGAVFRGEAIEATIEHYEAAGADVILVLLLTYSPSQLALPALQRTRLPVMVWNTQELHTVDSSFTLGQMIDNHGVHGTQDLGNVLSRAGVPFHYITSHLEDPKALDELNDFCVAAAAARRLRQSHIGLLGYPFPGMGDFAIDTTHLVSTLGCSWRILTVEDYIKRAEAAEAGEVTQLIESYRQDYDVAPDITEYDLRTTARVEIALRGMVQDHHLDALTYQFMAFGDDERTPSLPFVAASRLMADGIGFGGEGDLIAAIGTTLLNWLQPPASFSEIFTIDFGGNGLFMSHMGEANAAMARLDRKIPLVARPTPITRTRDRQLALVTSFQPGDATFVALTMVSGQRWRFVVAKVSIEDFGPLPSLCVPHFKMQPALDVRDFLTAYAKAGGPHHNAICFGDARPKIRHLASMLNADYCEI